MPFSAFTRWNVLAAAAALALTLAAWLLFGGRIFSPGELRASEGDVALGGIRSHAGLAGECGACHTPPWSAATMEDRCLECHADIQAELADSTTLHGALEDASGCLGCHTEHRGARADITRFDPSSLDHSAFGFPLTGAHERAECAACHGPAERLADFAGVPSTCIGCHRDDDVHRGEFGADCASCHSDVAWEDVRFEHTFPLAHGSRRPVACDVCHQDAPATYRTYTCYGCHEHTPREVRAEHLEEGIRDFQDCARCHPTGREEEGEREHEGGREHG